MSLDVLFLLGKTAGHSEEPQKKMSKVSSSWRVDQLQWQFQLWFQNYTTGTGQQMLSMEQYCSGSNVYEVVELYMTHYGHEQSQWTQ